MTEGSQGTVSLATQSAWLMFARTVGFILAFALPLIIVRRLSQDAVGVYRQAFQIAGDAAVILTLGFNLSAFYYFNRESEKRPFAALNILLFNFIAGALAFLTLFLFPNLLGDLFQNEALVELAPKIGVLIWLWLFSSFIEFAAIANQEARLGALFIVGTQLTKAVLMIAAVLVFETVESIVSAAIVQCTLQSLLLIAYLRSRFPDFWRSFDPGFFKEHAVYAIPFGLAGMLWTMQASIHFYFVGNRFSASEYAIYAYGCFQLPLVAILAESAAAVLLPRMIESELRGDYRAMTELIARAIEKLAFYYFAIYAYLFVVADLFIKTLFTDAYSGSIPIFVAYLTLVPLNILLLDPILRSFKGLGKKLVLIRLLSLLVLIAALWYAIGTLSLQGVVVIVVGVSIADRFLSLVLAVWQLGIRIKDIKLLNGVLKAGLAAAVAGLVTHAAYNTLLRAAPGEIASALSDGVAMTPRLAEFLAGSIVLGLAFAVFATIYLLVANAMDIIDEREKGILLKPWRFVWRESATRN